MQVYDTELILSWTPREFQNFIKGAQLRIVDQYEGMAKQAMFNRYAQNSKRAKEKKMFDAQTARKRVMNGTGNWKESREPKINTDRYRAAQKAMKAYRMKGG
ncbi:hypothetical protein A361_07940 [Cytobacillus oceanisediminis 2691]|uniref:Uncharacterized protein n=1 Tax=Cytobacillus oceanisediminis 2691 TaxID=1196031 RepID=A0A160MH65_9BACI|nr:hypothetical protein A361_07940 [Cytobacillus oceanisediminis 2691]